MGEKNIMSMTEDVFCEIYNKYKNTVYSVIFNYLKNIDDTADLQQEVFIRLYQANVDFESDEHLKAWLIRVSINLCNNYCRSSRHKANVPLSEEIPYFDMNHGNELLSVVLSLPEKYRIPLHLFYYEDYTIKQISDVLNMPENTIKVRLKRGREKLIKILNKEDWF